MRPSGLNATPLTWPWWPFTGRPSGLCVRASQKRTVPSTPAVASVPPSGLKATPKTKRSPLVQATADQGLAELSGVRVSQSSTVPSPPAEASVCPSGLNATP